MPKADGEDSLMGGEFGTSIAAIIDDFDRWSTYMPLGTITGERQCQCDWSDQPPYNVDCTPWAETLHGSFGDDEQFGDTLSVADLNCDGYDDLIVGAPGADLPTMSEPIIDAGAVYVYLNPHDGFAGAAPAILRQGTPEVGGEASAGDRFGSALAVGNFNGARRMSSNRSCFDLVVGTPHEGGGVGQIQVFEGGPDGLIYGGPILDLDDVFGATADAGDLFGWAIVAGDLNLDQFDDLVIGAPGDVLGGSIAIIPGSDVGLDLDNATWFRQGDIVAGDNVAGDQFGYALTWTRLGHGSGNNFWALVVGAPGENGDIGAVNVYRVSTDAMITLTGGAIITQGLIRGDELSGDRFGSTLLLPRAVSEAIYK